MITYKSTLLEQINSVIKKTAENEGLALPASPLANNSDIALKFSSELNSIKNFLPEKVSLQSFNKLEQRIEALEDQNNHLLYFIHFLYDNFPGLVKDILTSDLAITEERKKEIRENGLIESHDFQHKSLKNNVPVITRREREVIDLLVDGLCAKEIANRLFISENTVITHKKNLKKKFNVSNTVELIAKSFTLSGQTKK